MFHTTNHYLQMNGGNKIHRITIHRYSFLAIQRGGGAMYLAEVFAAGFRCYSDASPLQMRLKRGLNILVGPNDAGKTAIIDAPRYVLWTRGDDQQRIEVSDFHVARNGERATELLIRCSFAELSDDEQSRFLEWCTNEEGTLRLHVCLRAILRKQRSGTNYAVVQYRTGKDGDGPPVEADLREYLRAPYLRPLRDAERELRSGRRSRLSRILGALPGMAGQNIAGPPDHPTLADVVAEADRNIDQNPAIRQIGDAVNTSYLDSLSFADDPLSATLSLGVKGSFDQVLERLELFLNAPNGQGTRLTRGLGYNNILFMAAELLLLQSNAEQLPLLLIEEPEAHIHPQLQTLFMQVLSGKAMPVSEDRHDHQLQVLLSTHSPTLASSVDLHSMSLVINHCIFYLDEGETKLAEDDYAFLRRFLDATKANLFFARGVIVVEGDAEAILLPSLAKKIGKPLGKYGVSIVNVGHRGLFRYSRILQRAAGNDIPIPVALLPDRDIPPDAAKKLVGKKRKTESEWNPTRKQAHLNNLVKENGGNIRAFPSEQWTLEFDLARCPDLAHLIHTAIRLVKGEAGKTRDEIIAAARDKVGKWQRARQRTQDEVATLIFAPLAMNTGISKTQVAEQVVALMEATPDDPEFFRRTLPPYLVAAIDYVTPNQLPDRPGNVAAQDQ